MVFYLKHFLKFCLIFELRSKFKNLKRKYLSKFFFHKIMEGKNVTSIKISIDFGQQSIELDFSRYAVH